MLTMIRPNSPNTVNRRVFQRRQKSLAFLTLIVSGITGLALILTLYSLRQYQLDSRLLAAIRTDDTSMVITALKDGANPNCIITRTNDSFGPMGLISRLKHLVFRNDDTAIVETPLLYVFHGRELAKQPKNTSLRFHTAENASMVLALVNYGADPNFQMKDGTTALMDATWAQHGTSVVVLLQHGANPNLMAHGAKSPLMIWIDDTFSEYVKGG